jgi:hypothetical protein
MALQEDKVKTNEMTYIDVGDVRYFRHRAEPMRSFKARVDIPSRQGQMQPVLRLRGQATPDGRLQVVVTNTLTGESQVIEV